jgi:hypothetical protein
MTYNPAVPRWWRILHIIASSTRNRLRYSLGKIDSMSGSTMQRISVEASAGYARQVFADFLQYGKLGPAEIEGRTVLELGPGDNVGVLLQFIAHGASRAWACDKFYSKHDIEHEKKIYLNIRETLTAEQKARFDDAVDLSGELRFNDKKISYAYGVGAQDADTLVPPGSIDILVSRGVLQEVYEIDRAFAGIDRLTAPGGYMLHKVDLRDYGTFSAVGFHPREFLTVSDSAYHLMAYDTDKPNRRMLDYYRAKMRELGYQYEAYITSIIDLDGYRAIQTEIHPHKLALVAGVDYQAVHKQAIDAIRPRLAPRFQKLTDEELLAAAVFLVARKPAKP